MRKKVTAYLGDVEIGNLPLEIGVFDPRDDLAAVEWAKSQIEPRLKPHEREAAIYRLEEY